MKFLNKLYWFLSSELGFDPRRLLRSLRGIPRFTVDWWQFRKGYFGTLTWRPCLRDRYEEGGTTKNEYFWQDLLVARWIFKANPQRHVDVGSRIDGFVAHLASFREVEVFDIRPITALIPGVKFTQSDLMNPHESLIGYCDSLSCLHALEHFGLGRYGDRINPNGYEAGLANMVRLLRPGGLLYLSVPIGVERVEFNAHRIFNPQTLIKLAETKGLILLKLVWIGANGQLNRSTHLEQDISGLSQQWYTLGIFTFIKQ